MGIASGLASWLSRQRTVAPPSRTGYDCAGGYIVIDDPDTVILGCGWFDSSHDLRAGLAVLEGEAAELSLAVERMVCPT